MIKLIFLSIILLLAPVIVQGVDKNTDLTEIDAVNNDIKNNLKEVQQAFHDVMSSVGTIFDSAYQGMSSAHTYYKNYDHSLSFKENDKTIQIFLKTPHVKDSSLINARLSKDSLEVEIPQADRITKISIDGFSVIMQETQQIEQKNEADGAVSFHQSMSKRVESKNLPKQVMLQDAKVSYEEDGTVVITLEKVTAPAKTSPPARSIPIQKIQ